MDAVDEVDAVSVVVAEADRVRLRGAARDFFGADGATLVAASTLASRGAPRCVSASGTIGPSGGIGVAGAAIMLLFVPETLNRVHRAVVVAREAAEEPTAGSG